jgi:hypothetical protein
MKNQQPTPGDQITMQGTFHLLHLLAQGLATCFTVFTRHTFGQEALSWNGLCAFILIPVYAGFAEAPEMFDFWGLWFAAFVIQRLRTVWAVGHGWKVHSRYSGHPWLGLQFPFVKSYRGAVTIESLSLLVGGFLLCRMSEPLGRFMMFGGLSIFMVYAIDRQAIVMETRRMQDAELEMRMRTEIHQGTFNDF